MQSVKKRIKVVIKPIQSNQSKKKVLTNKKGGDIIIKLSNEGERGRGYQFFSQRVLTKGRRSDIIDKRSQGRKRRYLENWTMLRKQKTLVDSVSSRKTGYELKQQAKKCEQS